MMIKLSFHVSSKFQPIRKFESDPFISLITFHCGKLLLANMESNSYYTFHIGKLADTIMKTSEDTPTSNEARLTLRSLESLQREAILSARPPIWLNALLTLAIVGAFWLRLYQYPNESHPSLFLLAGAAVLLLALWVRRCRNLGFTPKFLPTNFGGLIFQLSQAAFFLIVIIGAKHLVESGLLWAGYVGIAALFIVIPYLFHNYPTNEWISRDGEP